MSIDIKDFLSAFFGADDTVNIRVFSDRKSEEPEYKGNKYSERLSDIDNLIPVLNKHNEKNRGIFFVVNSGGNLDEEISGINAQFVESDTLTVDEQLEQINLFILPPSIIIKTRKSLHTYWIMKDADVHRFREIQLRLARQFNGDTMCQNESRVLRVPGFNHCKKEPVLVECIKFQPDLVYTQNELCEHLPEIDFAEPNTESRAVIEGVIGSGERILQKCAFMKYCKEKSAKLAEPDWHAMVTNLSLAKDGAKLVHEISKLYPKYSPYETDAKIQRAISENKPHTCEFIKNRLGFSGCTDCRANGVGAVKAPVVHCILSLQEQVEQILESEITDESVFSDNTINLMAYAKKNAPIEYGRFKIKIKGLVSMRDFENAVNFKIKNESINIIEDSEIPLNLEYMDESGVDNATEATQPANWEVTMQGGIRKRISVNGGSTVVTVCPSPVVISKRFESVDNYGERIELSFYRDHKWKRFIAARSSVFNKSSLISFADRGLPVNSANSADLVSYLSDYENTNLNKIPLMKSTERLGWLSETSFFPYTAPKGICFETDLEDSSELHRNLTEHGNYEKWLNAAAKVRLVPYSRFMIAASFASPLLEPLSHRVFFMNIWHDTKSSKTAVAKMAVAVWGNPLKIMGSFNATAVGLERKADTLRNILYGLDERQMANEARVPISQIVYGLANGFGKIRGTKEGGVQSVTNWRLIILSTAEEPLIRDDSHDGINTRVFEIHGQPLTDIEFGTELHHISEKNYGFAGRIFIERLCREIKKNKKKVTSDFDNILSEIKRTVPYATHLENAAVVALGDYYSDMWIWNADKEEAFKSSVNTAVMMLKNNITHEKQDIIDRAWHYVIDWCAANERAFSDDAPVVFGIKENNNTYYVFKSPLDEALNRKNYPVEKCMTGFFERGYMKHWNGKRQKQKKTGGKGLWYYVITVPSGEDEEKAMPLT